MAERRRSELPHPGARGGNIMQAKSSIVAAVLGAALAGGTQAAEVKVLSSNAVKTALEELAPQFEKATEHKLVITFGTAAGLKTNIENGETFDVAILTAGAVDDLIRQGKVATRTDLVRSGAGVAVRKGA